MGLNSVALLAPLRSVQFSSVWRGGYAQGAHPCLRTYVSALVICWRK